MSGPFRLLYFEILSTMEKAIKATGVRTETGVDGNISWAPAKTAELIIGENELRFDDWVIPNSEIIDAVLNTERFLTKKRQSLGVQLSDSKCMFNFHSVLENDYRLPFKSRKTERWCL